MQASTARGASAPCWNPFAIENLLDEDDNDPESDCVILSDLRRFSTVGCGGGRRFLPLPLAD